MPSSQKLKKGFPLMSAYRFASQHGLQSEVDKIRARKIDARRIKKPTMARKGFIISLLEQHGLWKEFIQNHWPIGNTPWGERKKQSYLKSMRDIGQPKKRVRLGRTKMAINEKPRMVSIIFLERIEVRQALRMLAAEEGHGSIGKVVRQAIEGWLKQKGKMSTLQV
jgi:hypothetical protein